MNKRFNTAGVCKPEAHYMVNLDSRLMQIKELVDAGEYFTMNRARQYGKTTTLRALKKYLSPEYTVISMDFQMLSQTSFSSENSFVRAFASELLILVIEDETMPETVREQLKQFADGSNHQIDLRSLFVCLSTWCQTSQKPIVLMIDEVDSASNNQVFLDFLAQLRGYYLHRDVRDTFQSVILAGVYDVKNLKQKIRIDEAHKTNSPWNIAADFNVDMSFTIDDIDSMLKEYKQDQHVEMDTNQIASLLYEYTSGYPFLVSRICKLIDERVGIKDNLNNKWNKNGVLEAVKLLISEKNTLFESLIGKLSDFKEMRTMIYAILFGGESIAYNPDDEVVDIAMMFGFIRNQEGIVVITNRIFEMRLYNYFLSVNEVQKSELYKAATQDKNLFVVDGKLNMELVLEKYIQYFDDIYGDQCEEFDEEEGRRCFMLYMKPIINGTGNFYVEAQTRNTRRMDLVIDYNGEQFIVELKIWHGNAYNERGEKQLSDYLDYFHLNKGYMLSYNFNQKKQIGLKKVRIGNRILIEAVV